MNEFPQAPDLPASLEWVNCTAPRLSAMRGRVVAIAFWHAGSAPSANLLGDLAQLQARHADGLSVIGVHVPKFDAQRVPDVVAQAVNRLGLRYPVASDADAVAWQHYGIRAWPSVALVDCEGRLVEVMAGDQQREAIEQRVMALLEQAGERGLRVYENAQAVSRPEPLTEVSFPRGLALGAQRLYVSDSGHHRVLECSLDGRVLRAFGSGNPGFLDGLGVQAGFQSPTGLVLLKDVLYVADTGNHAIRRIRLATGEVDTLVGQGRGGTPQAVSDVRATPVLLDRPCGLVGSFDRLYIAMAGANQVWEVDLARHAFRPLAGSGRLVLADGVGALAAFAQPTGVALVQHILYVTDSQASAIRSLHLGSGAVQTLVGQGLQDFGLNDGVLDVAKLQFPLGLTTDATGSRLWVADGYNDAIRMLSLEEGVLRTVSISRSLRRPADVVCDGQSLWVANTDAHEVLRVELDDGQAQVLPMAP